jgi:hypothetical protein
MMRFRKLLACAAIAGFVTACGSTHSSGATLATLHDTYDEPVATDASSVYIATNRGIVRVAK